MAVDDSDVAPVGGTAVDVVVVVVVEVESLSGYSMTLFFLRVSTSMRVDRREMVMIPTETMAHIFWFLFR